MQILSKSTGRIQILSGIFLNDKTSQLISYRVLRAAVIFADYKLVQEYRGLC